MKTLVAGWFSFSNGHATAGDLLTRDLACKWLQQAGYTYDVAVAPPFTDGIDWRSVDPQQYSTIVFVCGPFEQGELELEFLTRFHHCRLIGLNLSMRIPLHIWNPFDLLIERDSSTRSHPDMVFGTCQSKVPVIGVCLVESYDGALVETANSAIQRLVECKEMVVVQVDTRLDINSTGLRSPAEIESLIARMDVVVTTRLHGVALALKNGVPVLAIDPEAGGAKIHQQAKTVGWPVVFTVDNFTDEALRDALDYCLTEEARGLARACGHRAAHKVGSVGEELVAALIDPRKLDANYTARLAAMQNQSSVDKYGNQTAQSAAPEESIIERIRQRMAKIIGNLRTLGARQYER